MTDYRELRVNYTNQTLKLEDLANNPLAQFQSWMKEAVALPEPNAMVIATADLSGQPSSRHVLLKEVTGNGFVFYSNYASRKGEELAANPKASLTFPWFPMYRQVNVVGIVEKISREESEKYFHSRPHESQLAALASDQSRTLNNREELEAKFAELKTQYPLGSVVPLPENWGGYLVIPKTIEFWSGRASRMHDRFVFETSSSRPNLADATHWQIRQLSP